ncbi:MAG: esterase [Porticoccaceae bacterium]|nr:esterase [Porticoccaceae bacterium]
MSNIWHRQPCLSAIKKMCENTIDNYLGIEIIDVGDNFLSGKIPVNSNTAQPFGIIHGGANIVLAESLGSIASAHVINSGTEICFGQEVNASHVRPVSSGFVTGTASPIHLGKRSHIWQIELKNDENKLSCFVKLTMAIKKRAEMKF